MRVLVTGGSGFIGAHLVARFAARHEVYAMLHAVGRGRLPPGVSAIVADLTQPIDRQALPARIDVVIHLAQANVPFPDGSVALFAVSTAATAGLLEYARGAGARQFVLASSGDVYGARSGPARETDPPAPRGFYAATKYAAELLVEPYQEMLAGCVLRLFQPYGPGQRGRLLPRLAERIRNRAPVALHRGDRPHVTPIFLDDVGRAFERVIESSYAGTMNVCGTEAVSIRELAEAIGAVLQVRPVYAETQQSAGDLMGDNTQMRERLGVTPLVALRDGLALTFGKRGTRVG